MSKRDLKIGSTIGRETVTFHREGDLVNVEISYVQFFSDTCDSYQIKPSWLAEWNLAEKLREGKTGSKLRLDEDCYCFFELKRNDEGEVVLRYRGPDTIVRNLHLDEETKQRIIRWFSGSTDEDTGEVERFCEQPVFGL